MYKLKYFKVLLYSIKSKLNLTFSIYKVYFMTGFIKAEMASLDNRLMREGGYVNIAMYSG